MGAYSDAEGAALVPTGSELKSYGVIRSLNRKGVRTVVASPLEHIPQFASRYCSEQVHLSASPEEVERYKDGLLMLARRPDVRTAYPVRECDVFVFAKYRDEFEEHVSLVTPDLDTLERAHDRYRLAREAEAAGVPYAETHLLSEEGDWDRDVVVKSRYNLLTGEYLEDYPSGRLEEVKRVKSVVAGDRPDADGLRSEMNHDPIVQDFVPQEKKHLYCALWEDGEPLATYQHRQIRQNSWVGGGGVYRKSVHSQRVEELAYDLLSHLGWSGYACVEYVKDAETGEWKFLEVNPRVWQSMPEAVRAGVDFPFHYWACATGRPELIDDDYEPGVRCHNAYGEVAHLLSVLRDDSPFDERPSFAGTLARIAASCLRYPRFDYIRGDDPRLFLSAFSEVLSTGVTSSRDYDATGGLSRPQKADGGRIERED